MFFKTGVLALMYRTLRLVCLLKLERHDRVVEGLMKSARVTSARSESRHRRRDLLMCRFVRATGHATTSSARARQDSFLFQSNCCESNMILVMSKELFSEVGIVL